MEDINSPGKSGDLIEVIDSSLLSDSSKQECHNSPVTAKEAENRYECPICFCFLQDPVITICGHRFCNICLSNCLENNEKRCPIDNRILNPNEIFPDNYTKREIEETVVICPNEGCLVPISAKNYEDHLENCKHRTGDFGEKIKRFDCPFHSVGCDFKITSLPLQLLNHLKHDVMQHNQLLLKGYKILSNQFQNCRNYCPHDDSCTEGEEFEKNLPGKLPFYLNDVYEKLTELEQRSMEYMIRMKNMSTQWDRCLSGTNYSKFSNPEMNSGVLVWKVPKFREMVTQMKMDRNHACYSPMFSTSEFGYRFRVRLMLSPKNSDALAILLHLVKGNYDFILKWPFVGEFTICIIHPLDPNLRLKSTFKSNAMEAFQRPALDINPRGFGFNETVRITELYTQGYVQDDKLIVVVYTKSNEVD